MHTIYKTILHKKANAQRQLAVLIDPDKITHLDELMPVINKSSVDYIFVGGSVLLNDTFDECVYRIKKSTKIPIVIFPGSPDQISRNADAILLLSLISGRNPDYLIGHHVSAAPVLTKAGIEIISTGYILIDGGKISSTSYVTNTQPIPKKAYEIAIATAMAGEMLGLKAIYLEAGSGATEPINSSMIRQVKKNIQIPLIVGGGIASPEKANEAYDAGADVIVIGNALETNPELLFNISKAVEKKISS